MMDLLQWIPCHQGVSFLPFLFHGFGICFLIAVAEDSCFGSWMYRYNFGQVLDDSIVIGILLFLDDIIAFGTILVLDDSILIWTFRFLEDVVWVVLFLDDTVALLHFRFFDDVILVWIVRCCWRRLFSTALNTLQPR